MPERESYDHGTPSWIDLSTTDPAGAREFYQAIFGWDFDVQPAGDDNEYIMAGKGDKAVAGIMATPPEMVAAGVPPVWNTYVTVDDLDQAVAKVEPGGGVVVRPPMQVMEAGRMAVVQDPTGATVCLWQAEEHPGAQLVNEHGALTWNECQTPDVAASAKFYGDLFGWTTDEMDMGPQGTYTVFMLGSEGVAGGMNPPMPGIPPHWGTVFAVDDTDACVEAARAAGGNILAEPFDIPVGRQAVVADPQGAVFSIINLAQQPDS